MSVSEAQALVERMARAHEREMDERCLGWIIMSRDEDFGTLYFSGVFPTREDAEREATIDGEQLHRLLEEGEKGWSLSVHRLMPDE